MELFNKIRTLIMGQKTYIIIALMALVSSLEQEAVLDSSTAGTMMDYLQYGGGATLTAKLNRFITRAEPSES